MYHLPPEVLLLILSFLAQEDKLECMTVCKQWCNIIEDHGLFRHISIYCPQQLEKLIEKVKRDRNSGKKVERLKILVQSREEYDESIFVELFPNLRGFFFKKAIDEFDESTGSVKSHQSHPWCERIEKMIEFPTTQCTRSLLHSGTCKNLTHISLTEIRDKHARGLIEALVNAPALNKLELRGYNMTFHDLELLHKNAPFLNSLFLISVLFDSESIPLSIQPATLMRRFVYNSCFEHPHSSHNSHLLYMRQKYTHLEELGFILHPAEPREQNYMNSVREQREVITSYLGTLGPRLKTFSLHLNSFRDDYFTRIFAFDIFDEGGCQIEVLNLHFDFIRGGGILEQLARCNQVKYIRSLTLSGIKVEGNMLASFEWFSHFTVLKELILYFYTPDDTLDLINLLDKLAGNKLETLRIENIDVCLNTSWKSSKYPSIKYLTLSEISHNREARIDNFISHAFPNLKGLKLYNYHYGPPTFELPMAELSYLEITSESRYTKQPLRFLLTTLDNNQQRVYTSYKETGASEFNIDAIEPFTTPFPYVSSRPYDGFTSFQQIVCKSVRKFSIIKTNISL